jgi:molecular chaperone GrpE
MGEENPDSETPIEEQPPIEEEPSVEAQLKAKEQKIQELESELKWAKADFDNFRKATEKRLEGEKENILARVLKDFLPFFDAFDKAIDASKDIAIDDSIEEMKKYVAGVEGLYRSLNAILDAKKLKRMSVVGKPFDYNTAEVMMRVVNDDLPEDTVVQEVQKGWMLNGKVLRHAAVAVSQKSAPLEPGPETEPEAPCEDFSAQNEESAFGDRCDNRVPSDEEPAERTTADDNCQDIGD